MHIEIFGKDNCPFCDMAVNKAEQLTQNQHKYTYKKLDRDFTREELLEQFPTARTFPQIRVDGKSIGGWQEFKDINEQDFIDFGHVTTDCQLFLENEFAEQAIGRVLIIGANQGINNPAYHLIKSGWKAVCCEPDPYACSILIERFSKYADNITIVNSAIVPNTGSLTPFYLSIGRPAMSSLKPDWIEKQFDNESHEPLQYEILTHTLGVQDLINRVGTDFDLVVIDAEGMDEELINAIDWSQLSNCSLLCCEDPGMVGSSTLKEAGFDLYHQNVNLYFKREI